jgi:hypothetical protein
LEKPAPADAPSWAVWEREIYNKLLRTVHKVCDQQRKDGFFWGGFKDDAFIPLGYAGIPFMGDPVSRKTFLRLYDGIEEVGAFKDGYCDIWPSDYLHITDIIVSRGLMVPYALGSPHVFEREMITAKVYKDLMDKNNAERAKQGLPPFELKPDSAQKEPKLWGEKIIQDYESTQVLWYWGKTPPPAGHDISDRAEITRELMTVALQYDDVEEFSWAESLHHTDKYGGVPGRQELILAALGGKLQGRIEPHPHSIVVSYDNPDPDIARLAGYADEKTTRLNFYNFKDTVQNIGMRLYRVKKGSYRLRAVEDANDNGSIDAGEALMKDESVKMNRFSMLKCEIPPRRNIVVEIVLEKEMKREARLPDLALDPDRDISGSEGMLAVKVHNIGDAAARDVIVEVLDEKGNVIDSQTVPEIEAPLDFVPKVAEVRLDLRGKSWRRAVIDRGNSIEEIFEENNEVVRR